MNVRFLAAVAAAAFSLVACGGSDTKPAPRRSSLPPADPSAEPAGVYDYKTSGFERLSAVFSSRHDYPGVSTLTVTRTGCGISQRWVPRPERASDSRFCIASKRWRLEALLDYHEFFGQAVAQHFKCKGPFVPRPPTVRVGFRWTDVCRGAGSRVTVRYEAVREQPIPVAGRSVKTIFVQARAELRGRIDGVNKIDSWLSRKDGLLVRRSVVSATAIDSPFGRVRDRERYLLELRSLSPR
jgi:hypothetical protein